MSTFSINSNIIHIGMIRNGCFDYQFDLNYPSQLNQIISQEQFEESINEINRSTNASFIEKFKIIICLLCAITGLVISVIGGIFQDTLNDKNDDLPKYEIIQFNGNSVGYHSTSNEQEQNPPPPYSSLCT
ncbi:unnamed protein product [Adineta steineri]|uniref:Golgin subfamily A member 7/ERF4 domain-containing protein n=1 Tax=Adineta steineri TaxID=433720 RepID=A0A814I8H4_9BILA|nr:unnamed protein product [Adineta steineri]CAF1112614.1 unnamed protein product [Adineta steineri]